MRIGKRKFSVLLVIMLLALANIGFFPIGTYAEGQEVYVVAADSNGSSNYILSYGDGTFSNQEYIGQLPQPYYTYGCGIGDFDNDGDFDYLIGTGYDTPYPHHIYLYEKLGPGNDFASPVSVDTWTEGYYPMDFAVADYNNDGNMDFVLTHYMSSNSELYLGNGDLTFTRSVLSGTAPYYSIGADSADFNNDRNLDFAAAQYGSPAIEDLPYNGTNPYYIYVNLGNGDGTFTTTSFEAASSAWGVTAADFDNDGNADIISGGMSTYGWYLYKGNGDGTFQSGAAIDGVTSYYSPIDNYDFDGDGDQDIIIGYYYSARYYSGNGDGTFTYVTEIGGGSGGYRYAISTPPPPPPIPGAPHAIASPEHQVLPLEGGTANFDGSASYDEDGWIVSYFWEFGDGYTATGAVVSHVYSAHLEETTYRVRLTVTDNEGKKGYDSVIVKIAPPEPTLILDLDVTPSTARVVDYDNGIYVVGTNTGDLYVVNDVGEYTVTSLGAGFINDVRIENPFIAVAAGSTVIELSLNSLTPQELWRTTVSGLRSVDLSEDGVYVAYLSTSNVGVISDGSIIASHSMPGYSVEYWLDATGDMEYIAVTCEPCPPGPSGTQSGVELYRFDSSSITRVWGTRLIYWYDTVEVRISENKDYVAVATSSGTEMCLLDLANGNVLSRYNAHAEQFAVDGDDDLNYVIGGTQYHSYYGAVYKYFVLKNDAGTLTVIRDGYMDGSVNDLDSSPDATYLAFGSDAGDFIVLKRTDDTVKTAFAKDGLDRIDATEIGSNTLLVGGDNFIHLYNLEIRVQGIDVSHHQGDINWSEVYGGGYRFAFIKATGAVSFKDPNFTTNMEQASRAGLLVGAYHFAYPEYNDAVSEAQFFVSVAKDYLKSGYLRPALDIENDPKENSYPYRLGKEVLSNWVHKWMETVKSETGIEPIIYVNSDYANNCLDISVAKYNLWIAHWTYDLTKAPDTGIWNGDWDFWQWSNESRYAPQGYVPGVEGNVDLDVFNGDMRRLYDTFVIPGNLIAEYIRPIEVVPDVTLVQNKITSFEIYYTSTFAKSVETDIRIDLTGFDRPSYTFRTKLNPGRNSFYVHSVAPDAPFLIPTAKPTVWYRVTLDPNNVVAEIDENDNAWPRPPHPLPWMGHLVTDTRPISILFVRVHHADEPEADRITPIQAETYMHDAMSFLTSTYPLASSEVRYELSPNPLVVQSWWSDWLLIRLSLMGITTYDRVVGVVNSRWAGWDAADLFGGGSGFTTENSRAVMVKNLYEGSVAHEIGHTYGLGDDYADGWVAAGTEVCKTGSGYWVERRRPVINQPTFMHAGQPNRWVDNVDYNILLGRFDTGDPEVLLLSGVIFRNGTAEFSEQLYYVSEGTVDIEGGSVGNYYIALLDDLGNTLSRVGFNITFYVQSEPPRGVDEEYFSFTIEWANGTRLIQLQDVQGNVLVSRNVSLNSPSVTVISPNGEEVFTPGTNYTMTWSAWDPDGDTLTYNVLISNGIDSIPVPIATGLNQTSFSYDFTSLPGGNQYLIYIVASDGVNVGGDVSDGFFTISSFTIGVVTPPQIVSQGGRATYTLNITSYGGFSNPVTLSARSSTAPNLIFQWVNGSTITPMPSGSITVLMEVEVPVGTEGGNHNIIISGVFDNNSQVAITYLFILSHDIAIINVTPSKTIAGPEDTVSINITVQNQGYFNEIFNVTAYYDTNTIGNQTAYVHAGASQTLTFIWNTTGVATGSYTISAYASPVPSETDTADNTFIDGTVIVDTIPPSTLLTIGEPEYVDPIGTIYVSSSTSFTLTAEDNPGGSGVASTAYRIYNATDDSGWLLYTVPFYLISLTDGVYTLEYNSTDNAGNAEPTNRATVILDNIGPSVTILNPPVGWALQDGVTFIASAIDTGSGVFSLNFSIREANGGEGTPVGFEDLPATYNATTGKWTLFFDTLQLPDGYYIVLVKAKDNLGNTGFITVPYSIRNWAVIELLPASKTNKAGRTMPVKFSLRVAASVDPNQPFVYNEDLTIQIYDVKDPSNILQNSTFGDTSRDYRIDITDELYITNFRTLKTPTTYVVQVYRKEMLIGTFEFSTVK